MKTEIGRRAEKLFRDLIEALDAKHLGQLRIEASEDDSSIEINTVCHADDYGKIVGAGGDTIKALNFIATLFGKRHRLQATFVLGKAIPGAIGPRPKFQAAENWDNEPIKSLLSALCFQIFEDEFRIEAEDMGDATRLKIYAKASEPAIVSFDNPQIAIQKVFRAIGKVMGRSEIVILLQRV